MNSFFIDTLFLYLSRASSVILPLIVVPTLADNLPSQDLARFLVFISTFQFMSMIVEAGLGLSAVRSLSGPGILKEEVGKTVTNFMALQATIVFLVYIVIFVMFLLGFSSGTEAILMAGLLLAFALVPDWYFVGRQMNGQLTIVLVLSRVFGVIAIIALCRLNLIDLVLAILLNYIYLIICAPFVSWRLVRSGLASLRYLNLRGIPSLAVEATPYAFSRFCISFYTILPTIFLSWFVDPHTLGAYFVIDKVKNAIGYALGPMTTKLFPYLRQRYGADLLGLVSFFRYYLLVGCIFSALLFFCLLFFEGDLKRLLHTEILLRWWLLLPLAMHPLFLLVSNFLGTNILLSFGLHVEFNITLISGASVSVFLMCLSMVWGVNTLTMAGFLFAPEVAVTLSSVVLYIACKAKLNGN